MGIEAVSLSKLPNNISDKPEFFTKKTEKVSDELLFPVKNVSPVKTEEKMNDNNLAKISLALIVGAVSLFLFKGVINKIKISRENSKFLNSIPSEIKDIFSSLKGKEGKEFVQSAYDKMVSHMKLNGIAPKTINFGNGYSFFGVSGGYDMVRNSISFSDDFLKLSKHEQFGLMSHELKHCEQFTNMLRLEGITFEKYSEMIACNGVNSALGEGLGSDFMLKYNYDKAVKNGKGKEFIDSILKQQTELIQGEVKSSFQDVLKLPKINPNSPEGQKVLEQMEAFKDYKFVGLATEEYENNLIEKEAYSFGNSLDELFKKYLSVAG